MSINPINVNSQGIGSSYGFSARPKAEEKGTEKPAMQNTSQQPQVAAGDVLGFMAQSAVAFAPAQATKSVNPANYVDSASATRIGEFMNQFEDTVATNLSAISKEFPGMSGSASYALAAKMVETEI